MRMASRERDMHTHTHIHTFSESRSMLTCSYLFCMPAATVSNSCALDSVASSWLNRVGVVSRRRALSVSESPLSPVCRFRREEMRAEVNWRGRVTYHSGGIHVMYTCIYTDCFWCTHLSCTLYINTLYLLS